MANEQNLIPFTEMTESRQREIASMGGKASAEARKKKTTMLSVLEKLLDEKPKKNNDEGLTYRELATIGLISGANKGNAENYKVISQLMEQKEKKEEDNDIYVTIPAKDIGSAFVDVNRDIDDREHREYFLEGGRGSLKSSFISEKIIELLENNPNMCA